MAPVPTEESSYRTILQMLAQPTPAVKKKVSSALQSFITKSNEPVSNEVSTTPVSTPAPEPENKPISPDLFRRRPGG